MGFAIGGAAIAAEDVTTAGTIAAGVEFRFCARGGSPRCDPFIQVGAAVAAGTLGIGVRFLLMP